MNHTLKLTRNGSVGDVMGRWESDTVIMCEELRNTYFGVSIVDRGRATHGGELQNDLPVVFSRAAVISAHFNGTADKMKRNGITVKLGDTLTLVAGDTVRRFHIQDSGDHYNAKLEETCTEADVERDSMMHNILYTLRQLKELKPTKANATRIELQKGHLQNEKWLLRGAVYEHAFNALVEGE